MKAADVSDREFLRTVDRLSREEWPFATGPGRPGGRRWVMWMEVEAEMPDVPWKVLLAKARKLMKRGLLDGCSCGCRGDYELTPDGRDLLAVAARVDGNET